jgi:hypothetical protein
MDATCRNPLMARCAPARRAMSLLELAVVASLLGLLALAGISRFGFDTLGNGGAEGYARKLSLGLLHARRATIATGDNHYLQLTTGGSSVTSFHLMRRASGGDVQVDQTRAVPADVTVTSAQTVLEFDFDGSALAPYSISVAGPDRSWTVAVTQLTGTIQVSETP